MIPIWDGTHQVHLDKVKRLMIKSARYVINGGKGWKTQRLMETCGWMNVRELVLYHSLLTLWKFFNNQVPVQIADKFTWLEDRLIETTKPRLQTTSNYWRWRIIHDWNNLSIDMRYIRKRQPMSTDGN